MTCVLAGIFLSACSRTVDLRYQSPLGGKAALPPSEAWRGVRLGTVNAATALDDRGPHVAGRTAFRFETRYHLSPHLSIAVAHALGRRLGEGEADIVLDVTDLRFRVTEDGFGLGGEAVLRAPGLDAAPVRLEHSVTVRGHMGSDFEARAPYTRLVEDFCDQILAHPKLLAALGRPAATPVDSALRDPENDVGPVVSLKPSEQGRDATGRVLWTGGDLGIGAAAMVVAGESKGGAGGLAFEYGTDWWDFRGHWVYGGVSMEGGSGFFQNQFFAFLMGYRGTVKDSRGYVDYPGVSLFAGPQFLALNYNISADDGTDIELTAIEGGGMVAADIPWGTRYVGSFLGYYGGVASGCITRSGTRTVVMSYDMFTGSPNTMEQSYTDVGCSGPIFLHAPVFDLWVRWRQSRFGLGLQFLAMSATEDVSWKQMLRNPTIGLTWMYVAGRGVATEDKSLLLGGKSAWSETEGKATPVNVFKEP